MGQFDPKDTEGNHPVNLDLQGVSSPILDPMNNIPVKYGELIVLG